MIAEHELLLDTIAHDIKNPILSLGITIELIKRLSDEQMERFPKLLDNLENSLSSMKNVVDGLTESRFDRHKYQATEEILDLQNIIEDVRLTLATQIQDRKALIRLDLQHTEIKFIRRKLRSVLYNLINNAIKYTPPQRHPEILISSKNDEGNISICVKDNGSGISEENKQSIFKKFERLQPEIEGTGVGLYLVNTIVTSAGGSISVESEPGIGSTFEIKLKTQ